MPRILRSIGPVFTALALVAAACWRVAPAAAATTPRYAHVAAYMIDGRIIVAGGMNAANTPINTVEILDTQRGAVFVTPKQVSAAAPMAVARASATITVLPNGNILVTGGWDGAVARNDGEVYDPTVNSWTTAGGMSSGRFNHTATLLNTGKVLVCGGQTGAAAAVTATCDLFDPSGAGGSFSGTGSLLLGRSLHTSTVLRDGSVWIAGGWNPTGANGGWVVTTERYTAGAGSWQSAQPLNAARAYHTATLTGDNKVLVVGGYNGHDYLDAEGLPSKGLLATSELFDPSGGSVVPGPPLNARVHKHTAVMQGDGTVVVYGGLGNIPAGLITDFATPPPVFNPGSTINGSFTGFAQTSNHTITSGAGTITNDFYLPTPVTGKIVDGEIQVVNPTVDLGDGGTVSLVTADKLNAAVGLRLSLAGIRVGCDVDGKCGYAAGTFTALNLGQGAYSLPTGVVSAQVLANQLISGNLTFNPATINTAAPAAAITAGSVVSRVGLPVPSYLTGMSVGNVSCTLTPTSKIEWAEVDLTGAGVYSVTLDGGVGTAAGTFPVRTAGSVTYIDIPAMTFAGLSGSILYTGTAGSISSPMAVPHTRPTVPSSLSCELKYSATGVDLTGAALKYDKLRVVVRNMLFGDEEWFDPSMNAWSFQPPNGKFDRPSAMAEGAATILTPQDDVINLGGRFCADAACSAYVAANSGADRQDTGYMDSGINFVSGGDDPLKHAFHSANLLPDGTILLAGGTDGAYVLPFAEIFDPATGHFTATQLMHTARQKHSANLLPNGRVLIAGGFATTAFSTGPTKAAEIYYPDTKHFIETTPMISSHSQHAAVTLPNGNVFIAGGYDNLTSVTGVAEVYYATASAWRQVASLPAGQERAIAPAVQLLDGRVMICGGTNASGIINTCLAYNPGTNAWTALAPMPSAAQGHTMTLMFDGRVLVAGGDDGFGETSSTYLYDPGTNTWAVGHSLNNARIGHSATLLPNGTIMISGGVQQVAPVPGSSANALQTVEFFHPAAASWNGSEALEFSIGPRSFHTATLGANGNVYFFGGADGSIGVAQDTAFHNKYEIDYFTLKPDGHSRIQPSTRQSAITSVSPSPFLPNTMFTAAGLRFRGATEASGGGAGSANASFNYPRLILQKIDGAGGSGSESSPGFVADLTTRIPLNPANLSTLDTNLSVTLPATSDGLPYGWYMTWVGNNDVHSIEASMVQVGPAKPAAAVGSIASTTLGTSSITYSWAPIAGPLDGYEIFSATSGLFLSTVSAATPNFTQVNLLPNTTASIMVAGFTITGLGPLTNSATAYTLPNPPSGLFITSVTFDTLALVWDANQNVPGTIYEVGQSNDDFVTSFSTPIPVILGLTITSATIAHLQPATNYYFRVRAYNASGIPSTWTPSVSTLTRTSVPGVSGVAVDQTSIRWNWIPSGSVINYKVYNSTSGQVIATTPSNSYLDAGLGIDTPRSVMVSAVTPAGEGPLSPAATTYTLAAPPGAVVPPLVGLTTGSFTVQWAPNGNPNGIDYMARLDDYSTPPPDGPLTSTATTKDFNYSFSGLAPSAFYSIFVYAVNGDGILSTPLVLGSTYTLARPPTNLNIVNTTPASLTANWDSNSNSTNTYYQVTYSTDNFVADVSTAIPFAALYNGTAVTINGLLTSTTYWVRVMAENPYGQPTSFSNVASTVTYNGGAPYGSVAGVVTSLGSSEFSGNLGNGRSVQVRSPGGAFPIDTTVTVSSYDATTPLCPGGLNVAFSITASPALQPKVPIYLTASYSPAEIGAVAVSRLLFERFEPVSGTCVPLQTTFDAARPFFTAQLNHFSIYQLVQPPLATDPGSLRIFPNPFRAATDSYITFDRIPPASRVRVTTLRGETVLDAAADGAGLLTWNATNGAGRSVASGLYIVIVEAGGSKKIAKLAVVR